MRLLKFFAVISIAWCGAAHALDNVKVTSNSIGNYIGMQVGRTILHSKAEYLRDDFGKLEYVNPSNNGFGMRLYWGYQFTDYIALEGGYGYYSPSIYNIPNGHSPELRIQTFDFLGKGIVPLFWGFKAYAKAGAAIVTYKEGGKLVPNPMGGTDGASGITMRPEIAAGLSYNYTPNWVVDISASRILPGGVVPASDMLAVGLTYHAVDLYCGQFLC